MTRSVTYPLTFRKHVDKGIVIPMFFPVPRPVFPIPDDRDKTIGQ